MCKPKRQRQRRNRIISKNNHDINTVVKGLTIIQIKVIIELARTYPRPLTAAMIIEESLKNGIEFKKTALSNVFKKFKELAIIKGITDLEDTRKINNYLTVFGLKVSDKIKAILG